MFKIDVSLKNLNDEMSLDILLFGSDKYKDTVNKKILVQTINFLKTIKCFERRLFFDRWYHFMTTFLISFLHSLFNMLPINSFKLLYISHIWNNSSQVLLGRKNIFVQYRTISILSEVSGGWRIVQSFNSVILF